MTTAYTSLLGLALPVTGELSGTWGDTVNNSITSLLDTSVAGTTNVSTDTDVTLTTTTGAANTARQAILLFSGARTALRTVTAPAQSKIYTVINATTGGFSVKLVGVGPTTGLTIPNGASAVVAWNGSDFVEVGAGSIGNLVVNGTLTVTGATTLQSTLAVTGNITNTAGTANGVTYLNGSKVVTSGSALTFDGTNFATTGSGTLKNLLFSGGTLPAAGNPSIALRSSDNVIYHQSGSANTIVLLDSAQNTMQSIGATANIFNISNSEAMRLTSTGLGIGTSSIGERLVVSGSASVDVYKLRSNTSAPASTDAFIYRPADNTIALGTANTERMRLDSSGNLGLGVTPSAWLTSSGIKTLQVGGSSLLGQTIAGSTWLSNNAFLDSGAANKYIYTGFAQRYVQSAEGQHQWLTAPSGTAGNAITFTQAMTLDASGNLTVGATSNDGRRITASGNTNDLAGIGITYLGVAAGSIAVNSSGALTFNLNNSDGKTERARISSVGQLGLGMTPSGSYSLQIYGIGSSAGSARIRLNNSSTGTADADGGGIAMEGVDLVIQNSENGVCKWEINGSERARITSGGNLLVGTTTSGGELARFETAGNTSIGIIASGSGTSFLNFGDAADANVGFIGYDHTNNYMNFRTNGAERCRIDSSGNLGLGVTPSPWETANSVRALQFNGGSVFSYSNAYLFVGQNFYRNSGGVEIYINTAAATKYQQAFGAHQWYNAPSGTAGNGITFTQAMTLDASGNLGVGTTSPATRLEVNGVSEGEYFRAGGGTISARSLQFSSFTVSGLAGVGHQINVPNASGVLTFATGSTERARIDSSGNLLVGTTSQPLLTAKGAFVTTGNTFAGIFVNDTYNYASAIAWNKATANDNIFMEFGTEGTYTTRGSISYNRAGGLTAYNVTSDYRAKDIYGPVTGSGALIDSTPVYMGKMKGATQERPMFIAHETPSYAHTGEKDAVDADGNPVYQQMDASALIPVMWAEIQSLRKRLADAGI